jgi:hypothetical protein
MCGAECDEAWKDPEKPSRELPASSGGVKTAERVAGKEKIREELSRKRLSSFFERGRPLMYILNQKRGGMAHVSKE